METFTDFFNPANVEYLHMDPHELGDDEIKYELALRNFEIRGTIRARASAVKTALAAEAITTVLPGYLQEAPYPIEKDLNECFTLCNYLDEDAKIVYIDSPTLRRKFNKCVHLMARLARMRSLDEDQMDRRQELQQRVIMLRYHYRSRMNPRINPAEIYEAFNTQKTPKIPGMPTPALWQRAVTNNATVVPTTEEANATATITAVPKSNVAVPATAVDVPITSGIWSTPPSAASIITILGSTPANAATTTNVGTAAPRLSTRVSKGAIPKTVRFGHSPFPEPAFLQ